MAGPAAAARLTIKSAIAGELMSLSGSDWVKLNQLLDEALELDPAHREQWVDSLPPEHRDFSDTLRDLLLRARRGGDLGSAAGSTGVEWRAVRRGRKR